MSTLDETIPLSDAEFEDIAALVHESFGIHLTDKKKALVRGRLGSLVRGSKHRSYAEYMAALRADPTGSSLCELINRISTNHSSFFREPSHYGVLTDLVLPALEKAGRTPASLRIWSAGCAAGEEPYTLAMILHDRYGDALTRQGPVILATDVSLKALEHATFGVYTAQRIEGVPERYRKYFRKAGPDSWAVAEVLRPLVLFKRLNLMRESYPFQGRFDAVFCRNVMIYFDQPTRTAVVEKIHRHLGTGGHLFIGHSETLGRDTPLFRYVRPTVYRK